MASVFACCLPMVNVECSLKALLLRNNLFTQFDKAMATVYFHLQSFWRGWLGEAKVSCILLHWGVQLSWARPAILAAGKGRGEMFLFLLVLHFHSFSSFSPVPLLPPLLSLLSFFSLSLGDNTKWPTRVDMSLKPNTINQSFWQRVLLVKTLIRLLLKVWMGISHLSAVFIYAIL